MYETLRALVGQILSRPGDPRPRLVLADWLEENGRPRDAPALRTPGWWHVGSQGLLLRRTREHRPARGEVEVAGVGAVSACGHCQLTSCVYAADNNLLLQQGWFAAREDAVSLHWRCVACGIPRPDVFANITTANTP